MDDMKDKIRLLVEGIAFKKVALSDPLFSSGLLDSMGIVDLALSLEKEFDVKIGPTDITEDNFDTVENIARFINKLRH
jgi:D-alanine--poly(phosphoribitol) ligase subunit 2